MQAMCSFFKIRRILCPSYSKTMICKDGQNSFQLYDRFSAIVAMDVKMVVLGDCHSTTNEETNCILWVLCQLSTSLGIS